MRACRMCGESKPLSDFYRQPRNSDGYFYQCKVCVRASQRAYEHSPRGAAKHRARQRRRRRTDPEKYSEQAKQWQRGHPDQVRQSYLARCQRWPEKFLARRAVGIAIKSGRLQKQPCEVCGSLRRPEAHHDDYSQPLSIRWFCSLHHKAAHQEAPC